MKKNYVCRKVQKIGKPEQFDLPSHFCAFDKMIGRLSVLCVFASCLLLSTSAYELNESCQLPISKGGAGMTPIPDTRAASRGGDQASPLMCIYRAVGAAQVTALPSAPP